MGEGNAHEGKASGTDQPASPRTYARFGCVYCFVPEQATNPDEEPHGPDLPDPRAVLMAVAAQLKDDPRVVEVRAPGETYMSYRAAFPRLELDPLEAPPPSYSLTEWTLEFAQPLSLTVSVPKKNQPGWEGDDGDIAADTYISAWDGSMLTIAWKGPNGQPPHLGGQVVRDILVEAIDKARYRPRIQGPSPAHVDLRINIDPTATVITGERVDWRLIDLNLPDSGNLERIATELHWAGKFLVQGYYDAENSAETFQTIKRHLDLSVEMLLRLQHQRAKVRVLPFWQAIRKRWRLRSTRRGLRELLARVLLEIAMLQGLRETYLGSLRNYSDLAKETGLGLIFDDSIERDSEQIQREELAYAQAAIDHVAGRLDTRDVVVATLWGVLAGAGLGIVGTLLAAGH